MRTVACYLRVYPRACGGTELQCPCRYHGRGLIPAPAGEPGPRRPFITGRKVYPRACGGTTCSTPLGYQNNGLSPRLRGTLWMICATVGGMGLSPRLRGNRLARRRARPLPGSIPAPAGNLVDADHRPEVLGSIPAPAGEPGGCRLRAVMSKVYPRACGGTPCRAILTICSCACSPGLANCTSPGTRRRHPQCPWGPRPECGIRCSPTAAGSRHVITMAPRPSS